VSRSEYFQVSVINGSLGRGQSPGPSRATTLSSSVQGQGRAGQGTRAQARHEGPSALRRVLQKDSVWGYGDQVGSRVPDGRAG